MKVSRVALFAVLFTSFILVPSAWAQQDNAMEQPDVVIEMAGLACPFCAYGVEKRLKKLDAVDQIALFLEEGTVHLKLKDGFRISTRQIEKAISDAGFEAISIEFPNENAKEPSDG